MQIFNTLSFRLVVVFGIGLSLLACSSNSDDVEETTVVPPAESSVPKAAITAPSVNSAPSTTPVPNSAQKQPEQQASKPFHVAEAFAVGRDVYVRSLEVSDVSKTVWVGTSVGALEVDLATQEVKGTYTRREGLANEYVFAMLHDSSGSTWFGTNGGGVSRKQDGQWKTYFPMHGLADYWVYSFAEQPDQTLWIGTWAGVNHFNPKTEEFKTYVKELVNEWVYGIAVDKQNRAWFGTEGGVSMFDGSTWQSWNHDNGLGAPNSKNLPISTNTGLGTRSRHDLNILSEGDETYNPNYVFCIMVDQKGVIWAGTWGGGVSRFDGKEWKNLTTADGLAGNVVFSVTQDDKGVYWFGTDKGLSSYDGSQWHTYTNKDGLLANSVYAVHPIANGDLWVGTKSGVARLTPGSKSK